MIAVLVLIKGQIGKTEIDAYDRHNVDALFHVKVNETVMTLDLEALNKQFGLNSLLIVLQIQHVNILVLRKLNGIYYFEFGSGNKPFALSCLLILIVFIY